MLKVSIRRGGEACEDHDEEEKRSGRNTEKKKRRGERWEERSWSCCLTGGFLGRAEMISDAHSVTLMHPSPHKQRRAAYPRRTRAKLKASHCPTRLPQSSHCTCDWSFQTLEAKTV